jgi:hypothetical protein
MAMHHFLYAHSGLGWKTRENISGIESLRGQSCRSIVPAVTKHAVLTDYDGLGCCTMMSDVCDDCTKKVPAELKYPH